MKRILAAIDSSAISKRVLEEAGKLAQPARAEVIVLYVMSDAEATAMLESHMEKSERHAHDWMQPEEKAHKVADEAMTPLLGLDISHKAIGAVGDAAQMILDLSKSHNADLIVMGFHGHHGIGKLKALGSVSRAVMESTDCPVLIVPALKPGE